MKEENPENQTLTFYNKENESENKKPTKKETTKKRFVIIFCFILSIAVLVPLCIYFITINIVIETDVHHTCAVDDLFKIPCGRVKISENDCLKINCCFDDQRLNCYHYMPSKYNYVTENGLDFNSLQPRTPFNNNSISQLKLSIIEIDSNRMKIMVHEPSTKPNSTATIQNKTYHVKQDPQFLGVQIFRQDTKEMILSTLMGPLIASDHYWEWTIYLVNDHIFGLGDIVFPKNKTFSKVIYKNKNNHNTLPNFMVYLNGSFYGILVEHDGPLEVTVFPGRIISLKSLAGYKISVNIYTGPTIQNVIEQMRLDGSTYSMPYWSLGIHICRDGLTTIDNALKEFEEFYSTQNDIHYASDCVHENLYNLLHHVKPEHGLPALITSLQQKQTKFLMSMPPQVLKANEILYNSSVELNILYRNSSDEILNGIYKNEEAAYPDYTHSSIGKWFEKVKSTLPTNIDGFVLRDNWPQEDVYIFRDPEYNFPYMTDVSIRFSFRL
ncbi:hypothetical protein FQR65_LT14431 [Abscondita terminalis]|nr:hypothetical protein FQR65_LT14431 [Abscondita terminalis]